MALESFDALTPGEVMQMALRTQKIKKARTPERLRAQMRRMTRDITTGQYGGSAERRAAWALEAKAVRVAYRTLTKITHSGGFRKNMLKRVHRAHAQGRASELRCIRFAAATLPRTIGLTVFRVLPTAGADAPVGSPAPSPVNA